MSETAKRGRPREFRNDAEKQKAYRERKKADDTRTTVAFTMLDMLDAKVQSLRNSFAYWNGKGQKATLNYRKDNYAQILAGGYSRQSVQCLVVDYMLLTGQLVEVRRDWNGVEYVLKENEAGHENA